jgi:arabinofuranosyltransferase
MRIELTAVIGAALLCVASVLFVGPSHADDTFIYMRYIDNLLKGNGLTFNPGEPSHGLTSMAWPLVMVGPAVVLGNTIAVWKAVSWACYFMLSFAVLVLALRQKDHGPWTALIAVAVLTEPHFFRWSGSGMDNALVGLMVLALLAAWRSILEGRGHAAWTGALLAISPFVRPELAVLAALVAIEWAVQARRRGEWTVWVRTMIGAGLVAVLAASVAAWATGFWLPQTAKAKALTYFSDTEGYAFRQAAGIVLSGCAAFLVVAAWLARMPRARPLVRPVLVFMLVLWGYYAWQNHLVSSRYSSLLNLPIMFAVLLSLEFAVVSTRTVAIAAGVQILVAVTVLTYTFAGTRTNEGQAIAQFAERVRRVTSADARIALSEVGAFGFYSDRYTIDLVGLTDPETVEWLSRNGRVRTPEQLERLLVARRATHYVDAFAGPVLMTGRSLTFTPLTEAPVMRNNSTTWDAGLWRLYKIEPR